MHRELFYDYRVRWGRLKGKLLSREYGNEDGAGGLGACLRLVVGGLYPLWKV